MLTMDEAFAVILSAPGELTYSVEDGRLRVRYIGTDAEDEGRVAEALLVLADGIAEVRSITTDNVHMTGAE